MEPRSDQIVGRDKTVTTVVDRRWRVVRPPPLWRFHRSNFVLNIGNVSSHADRVSGKKGCQKQSNKRYFFLLARWNHLLRSARTTFRSPPLTASNWFPQNYGLAVETPSFVYDHEERSETIITSRFIFRVPSESFHIIAASTTNRIPSDRPKDYRNA